MLPASAIPVIFGVESFVADELDNEFGASGAVVSGSPIVIDKGERDKNKPSDHVPIIAEIDL